MYFVVLYCIVLYCIVLLYCTLLRPPSPPLPPPPPPPKKKKKKKTEKTAVFLFCHQLGGFFSCFALSRPPKRTPMVGISQLYNRLAGNGFTVLGWLVGCGQKSANPQLFAYMCMYCTVHTYVHTYIHNNTFLSFPPFSTTITRVSFLFLCFLPLPFALCPLPFALSPTPLFFNQLSFRRLATFISLLCM